MDSKKKAVKGVFWSAIEKFAVQGVQFFVSIVLARLLTPNDFGLIAIVLVFSTIFQTINESGFNMALIHKQDRDDLDYSTAFVTNLVIGFISYSILFFIAPFIASFYANTTLIVVMRILSLTLLINAVSLVPRVTYTISVDFKTQAKASLIAAIVSGGVGIVSAYIMRNVFAIVIQQLTFCIVNSVLLIIYAKWLPSFRFSRERFDSLFAYSYKLIGARVISIIFDDIYSLAIGKLYTPASLGCYNRAQALQQVLSKNIINIVQRVSVPMLCQVQNDNNQMKQVLLKFLSSTALIVFPMLAGLMVLSYPLIIVLLGEKWSFTADILMFTCPIGFFFLISTFNRNIYNATGRTDLALKTELVKKCIYVLIFILTMRYEISILLWGLISISIIEMLIDTAMVKKQIRMTFFEEFKSIWGILFTTLCMSVIVYFVAQLFCSNLLKLIFGGGAGVVFYILTCYIFNIANARMEIMQIVKKSRKSSIC